MDFRVPPNINDPMNLSLQSSVFIQAMMISPAFQDAKGNTISSSNKAVQAQIHLG